MHQPYCPKLEELESCLGRHHATEAEQSWHQTEKAEDQDYKGAMFASLLSAVKFAGF